MSHFYDNLYGETEPQIYYKSYLYRYNGAFSLASASTGDYIEAIKFIVKHEKSYDYFNCYWCHYTSIKQIETCKVEKDIIKYKREMKLKRICNER